MIKVGLSGNRFSGKDTISQIFRNVSIPVFDADVIVKFVLNYNYELIGEIIERLGTDYVLKDYRLDLNLISRNKKFSEVLKIIEKDIFKAYQKFEDKNKNSIYTIFNSSILYEAGWQNKMDTNITVYAPFIDRVERGKSVLRGQYHDRTTINTLLSSEMDELTKNGKADHVIHNYNEFNIQKQVMEIDQIIIDNYIKYHYEN